MFQKHHAQSKHTKDTLPAIVCDNRPTPPVSEQDLKDYMFLQVSREAEEVEFESIPAPQVDIDDIEIEIEMEVF